MRLKLNSVSGSLCAALCAALLCAGPASAESSASLQFTVAAPDPVMAGDQILMQTLVVNTGNVAWTKGSYYWVAEIYDLQGETKKFIAQTEPLTPAETVPPGTAHGVQIPYVVPEMFSGHRLLYRAFLVMDGKRLLETEYKGFQVIEKEYKPPPEQDVQVGGDVTLTYKNSSPDGWSNSQGITAANIVGKIKHSSFIFNAYLIHSYHRPLNANMIFLNFYAPWGTLSLGDVSPTLTPLSMDGQGMRGASFERTKDKVSWLVLAGRIVASEEPTLTSAGRFSRYTGGMKVSYQTAPNLKITIDSSLSRDDEYSITQDTRAVLLVPQQSFLYGAMYEWKASRRIFLTGDFQSSQYKADINSGDVANGTAWKQELRWKGRAATARAAYSVVGTKFKSFASPSVVPDRKMLDADASLPVASWSSFSAAYNTYTDNLENDPAKDTTLHTQTSLTNTSRVLGGTVMSASLMMNTALGKQASVQDNKTTTLSFSVLRPFKANTLSASVQQTAFKDNTGLSNDLDTRLFSLSGSFKLSKKLSASAGGVKSDTKDKVASTTAQNNTLNGSLTYARPGGSVAYQLWSTLSSGKNDSVISPADYSTLTANFETIWMKSKSSKLTFGIGAITRSDKINPASDGTDLNFLTRYNYSF